MPSVLPSAQRTAEVRTSPPTARVSSSVRPRPPHDTVVAALEAAADTREPLLTLHGGRRPEAHDPRALLQGAFCVGGWLQAMGVRPGDRVPILLPTSADFVHALLGTMLVGAVPVPLATPMTFGGVGRYLQNLAAVVEDADARCLVTSARLRDAAAEEPRLAARLRNVLVPQERGAPGPPRCRPAPLDPSDAALLQYTSGTTGRPKGVVISHRALVSNAFAIAHGLSLGPEDVGVSWLPMFHDMGLIGVLVTALCHPYPVHLIRPESFVMQPRRWLTLLSQVGGTVSAAPNFAYDLCATRVDAPALEADLARWRVALNGSEPVHPETVRRFGARFADHRFPSDAVMPVYGLAESTLAVTFPCLDRKLESLRLDRGTLAAGRTVRTVEGAGGLEVVSAGRPVAGASVRIVHAGAVTAERVVGEVQTTGPSLMDGYFRNGPASADAVQDGWLRTGDLGFLDGGRLFLVGRAKEVIIKGGRNYYPHDVERIASGVSGAEGAAAAFARPNPDAGTEDLIVVVEARDRSPEGRERIAREARGELLAVLGVKADQVHVCPFGAIPRTTSGKVRRAACEALLGPEGSAP